MKHYTPLVLLLSLASVATAQTPDPKPIAYAAAGMASGGAKQLLQTADAEETLLMAGDTGVPACMRIGQMITLKANDGGIVCCWTQEDGMTLTAVVGQDAYDVTDGITAPGACFSISDNERVDQAVRYSPEIMGSRSSVGICSAPTVAPGGSGLAYPACDADNDCTTFASGLTCDTTLDDTDKQNLSQRGCYMLRCMGDTANTYIDWRVEK